MATGLAISATLKMFFMLGHVCEEQFLVAAISTIYYQIEDLFYGLKRKQIHHFRKDLELYKSNKVTFKLSYPEYLKKEMKM